MAWLCLCPSIKNYFECIASWSTLAQVLAWCLMAPRHYLSQCWLVSGNICRTQIHSLSPGILDCNFRWIILKVILMIDGWVFLVKLPSKEYHWNLLMIFHNWFRSWFGAIRQQSITWANVDPGLCYCIVLLGHNELMYFQMTNDGHFSQDTVRCTLRPDKNGCHFADDILKCIC